MEASLKSLAENILYKFPHFRVAEKRFLVFMKAIDLFNLPAELREFSPIFNRHRDTEWINELKANFEVDLMPPLTLAFYLNEGMPKLSAIDSQHRISVLEQLLSTIGDRIITLDIHLLISGEDTVKLLTISNKRRDFKVLEHLSKPRETNKPVLIRSNLEKAFTAVIFKTNRPYLKPDILDASLRLVSLEKFTSTELANRIYTFNQYLLEYLVRLDLEKISKKIKLGIKNLKHAISIRMVLGLENTKQYYKWANYLDYTTEEDLKRNLISYINSVFN